MRKRLIKWLNGFPDAASAIATLTPGEVHALAVRDAARFAKEQRLELILALQAFPDLEAAIKHMRDTDAMAKKREILALAVKRLFNAVSVEDILQRGPDGWLFEGRPVSDEEMKELRTEAENLRTSKLWRVLKFDLRYQFNKKMFEESKVDLDVVWGQLLLFSDDSVRQRLKLLAEGQ